MAVIAWRQHLVTKLLDKPITTVLLILVFATVSYFAVSRRLPQIPNWSWQDHPKVLFINYFDGGCGCLETMKPRISAAQKLRYDIIIAKSPNALITDTSLDNFKIIDSSKILNLNLFEKTGSTTFTFIVDQKIVNEENISEIQNALGNIRGQK
jgi:hypothetical protein